MISLAEEDVVVTFVQAILFGLYLVSLAHCLRWQIVVDEGWRNRKKVDWIMMIIAFLLFLLSTIDLGIRLHMTIVAVRGDPRIFQPLGMVVSALEAFAMLTTDAVLIYRCWVIHARSWPVVCVPIFFWMLFLASSIVCVFYLTPLVNFKDAQSAIHALILEYFFWIVYYCANIVTNIYATSAIVLRILKVARGNDNSIGSERLHHVSRILAESGILYTSTSVLSLIGAIAQRWPELSIFGSVTSILNFCMTGIAFNLILIRVALNRSNRQNDSYTESECSNSERVLSTMEFSHFTVTRDSTSKLDAARDSRW